MRTLTFLIALFIAWTRFPAQAQTRTANVTFTISNITERQGTLRLGLVTKAENFMGQSEIDTTVAIPASGPLTITFRNLPVGNYAARAYQDLNGNKQLDGQNGRPTEPFGFSKITMLMGPPSFEDAVFNLDGDTSQTIVLMNL